MSFLQSNLVLLCSGKLRACLLLLLYQFVIVASLKGELKVFIRLIMSSDEIFNLPLYIPQACGILCKLVLGMRELFGDIGEFTSTRQVRDLAVKASLRSGNMSTGRL